MWHKTPDMKLIWMLLAQGLSFMIREDVIKSFKEEEKAAVLLSCDDYETHQHPAMHDDAKGAVSTHTVWW